MKKKIFFLTYFQDNSNRTPSGAEIYHDRVFSSLKKSSAYAWRERAFDTLPPLFRFKGMSHLYYALLFLFAPPDMAILDAGYVGRCAFALFLLRLRKIPLVLVVHHFNFHLKENPLARAYDILCCRLAFGAASRAILNSEFTADEIETHFHFAGPALIVHPSLSLDLLENPERSKPAESKTVRCLYVGSVEPRKNLEALVELANRADPALDFVITVAGKETLHPEYARGLRSSLERPDRVRFLGYVDAAGLKKLYLESDLFLFPSKWEGFGMAVLEALCYGVPVVAFAASSLPYLIENGVNGELIAPYDTGAFVAAAARLISDPAARAKLAANCRLEDKFKEGWEAKAERVSSFLSGVLPPRKNLG
jgi:glycosyltransferase involved in cell wall biosynthesis